MTFYPPGIGIGFMLLRYQLYQASPTLNAIKIDVYYSMNSIDSLGQN